MALSVAMQHQTIGRAVEAGNSTLTQCYWDDEEEALCQHANMPKVSKTKLISYANEKLLKVYLYFAFYYQIAGGRRSAAAAALSKNI